jgi:hypothetical protein
MSLDKLKRRLNEFGFNIPINEMAYVGTIDQYSLVIETNDHNPPHFHVKLNKTKTVCRIEIPRDYPLKTYDLVYFKNSKIRLSSRVEKELIEWLKDLEETHGKFTNLESLQFSWNLLHPDNKTKW